MKIYLWAILSLICNLLVGGVVYTSSITSPSKAIIFGLILFLASNWMLAIFFLTRFDHFVKTIELALTHFKEGEFSLSFPPTQNKYFKPLGNLFREVATHLSQERSNLMQRELLLDRVFDTVSSALLLTDSRDKIILCNPAAAQLLSQNKAVKGLTITELLPMLAPSLADAMTTKEEALFILEGKDREPETWHLSCEIFYLNERPHSLYHFKQMTRTLARAEVDTWKKVIRVLSHELNNSLAPITSLTHSGKQILIKQDLSATEKQLLHTIFDTLGERSSHLTRFLSAYAKFARLPKPQAQNICWSEFFNTLKNLVEFELLEPLPLRDGYADSAQLSQVIINLVKNSQEAGASKKTIELHIAAQGEWDKITLTDSGCGMSEDQLSLALLPFYSTKRNGTGLGLALCREIIDAHGGRMNLANRAEGGLQVTLWLPAKTTYF